MICRIALIVVLTGIAASADADDGPPTFAFVNAGIVRADANRVEPGQTIIVTGTRIIEIGPSTELLPPPGAVVIDAGNAYVSPGLAEMHAHVPHHDAGETYLHDVLFLWVANGVTTIRGMNGEPEHLELRDRIARGEVLGPRLLTAGPPFIGRRIKTAAEAGTRAAAQADAGYDLIKVHMGISRTVYDAVARTSRRRGIPFAGHVAEDVGLWHALESGQASIDHLDGYMPALVGDDAEIEGVGYGLLGAPLTPFIDEEKFIAVAHSTRVAGVWNAPTLSMAEKFIGPIDVEATALGLKYMPPKMVRGWIVAAQGFQKSIDDPEAAQKFLDYRKQLVKSLHDVGAGLLLASDAPQILNVPGFSIHRELEMLVEAGLTPAEALTTGTVNPAIFVARSDTFGRVAVGLDADLILTAENPLQDLATLRDPLGVMVRGRWLPAEELQAGLARIAQRNQAGNRVE